MSSWMRTWVVAVILGVFGPYVVAGVRTEQLAIYGSAAGIVVTQLPRLTQILRPAALVVALWAAYVVVVVGIGTFAPNRTGWQSGSLVAGVDNALLPLASIVTFAFWTWRAGSGPVIRLASWVVAIAMAANALVAVVTTYFGLDVVPGLGHFWAPGGADASVAVLAEQMGRFSGIFNQPAEAGIAYTIATLALVSLCRTESTARRRWLLIMLPMVVVGGLLTLSKVFAVGGLFLALVLALTDRRSRRLTVPVGVGSVVLAIALGVANLAGSWGAAIMLNWYRASVQAGDSPIYTISAGRFGSAGDSGPPSIAPTLPPVGGSGSEGDPGSAGDAQTATTPLPTGLADVAREILGHQPILGVGARGLQVAYDSTWAEALIVGGVVGLTIMVLLHVTLVGAWLRARRRLPEGTWPLAGVVLLLTFGASFGMPALTGNRESTLLWLFLVPLIVAPRAQAWGAATNEDDRESLVSAGQSRSAVDSPG